MKLLSEVAAHKRKFNKTKNIYRKIHKLEKSANPDKEKIEALKKQAKKLRSSIEYGRSIISKNQGASAAVELSRKDPINYDDLRKEGKLKRKDIKAQKKMFKDSQRKTADFYKNWGKEAKEGIQKRNKEYNDIYKSLGLVKRQKNPTRSLDIRINQNTINKEKAEKLKKAKAAFRKKAGISGAGLGALAIGGAGLAYLRNKKKKKEKVNEGDILKTISTILNEMKLRADYGLIKNERIEISKNCKKRVGKDKVKYTDCMIRGLGMLRKKYISKLRNKDGDGTSARLAINVIEIQINQYKEELRRLKSL